MTAYGYSPVFDSIINDKLLKHNIITFYYSNDNHSDGQITLGFLNKSKFKGKLKYYKVIDKYYWALKLDDILLDGKSTGLCKEGCRVAVDTGTSLITGPTNKINKLFKAISVQDDCSGYVNAQDLAFVLNGDKYTLKGPDYILKKDYNGKEKCRALLMPLDISGKQ